jgi:hypothetical protein
VESIAETRRIYFFVSDSTCAQAVATVGDGIARSRNP